MQVHDPPLDGRSNRLFCPAGLTPLDEKNSSLTSEATAQLLKLSRGETKESEVLDRLRSKALGINTTTKCPINCAIL